jgi:hypothetical protein
MMKKRIFQWFTFFLLLLTVLMAINNVVMDDAAVRALAKKTAVEAAGCGDACRMSGFRGERGMINETIEYDFDPQGHYVVQCHRAMLAVGEYICVVTEGKRVAPASSATTTATPPPSHSAH